jgi:four helix bundle protein
VQRFTEIKVWQRSHALALVVYKETKNFPPEERYGITNQLRRAVSSVPTNIAEGSKRKSNSEYARFLNIAEGSAAETEYLLILSRDLGYLGENIATTMLKEIGEVASMLHGLRTKVENDA